MIYYIVASVTDYEHSCFTSNIAVFAIIKINNKILNYTHVVQCELKF